MVHKKYIKRGDKIFGPYLYENKRVGDRIVTHYLGLGEEKKEGFVRKFKNPLFVLAGIVLVVALVWVFSGLSGHVVLDLQPAYVNGSNVTGNLNIIVKSGELIPKDSKLYVSLGDYSREFSLKNLIDERMIDGSFYVQGKEIMGNGEGFGLIGKKNIYPELSFKLGVFDSINGGSDSYENEVIIEGKVSKENNFEYAIEAGKNYRVLSVEFNGSLLSNNSIDVAKENGKLIVSTDYSYEEEGFGKEYFGDGEKIFSINLEELNIIAVRGNLEVKLNYGDDLIAEVTSPIKIVSSILEAEYIISSGDVVPPAIQFQGDTPSDGQTLGVNNFVVDVESSDNSGDHYVAVDFNNSLMTLLGFDEHSGNTFTDLTGKHDASVYGTGGCSGGIKNCTSLDFSDCSLYNYWNSQCEEDWSCLGSYSCENPTNRDWCVNICGGIWDAGSGVEEVCIYMPGPGPFNCISLNETDCGVIQGSEGGCAWDAVCSGDLNLDCSKLDSRSSCSAVSNLGCSWPTGVLNITSGKFGNSTKVNHSEGQIVLSPYLKLSNMSSWSLSAWLNTNPTTNNVLYFDGKENDLSKSFIILVADDVLTSSIGIYNNGENIYNYGDVLDWPWNEWAHLVLTYNGSQIRYYLNGDLVNYSSLTINDSGWDEVLLGDRNGDVFNGKIDEFSIYNRTISSDEVKSLYNASANQYNHHFSSLTEGNYSFKSYAIDLAGNNNEVSMRRVLVDTPTPTLIVNSPTTHVSNSNNVLFDLTLDADGREVKFSLDNGATNYTLSSSNNRDYSYTYSGLNDGAYTANFYVDFIDGNRNYSVVKYFEVSVNPPSIEFISPTPAQNSEIVANIILNSSVSDDRGDVYAYYVTGLLNWYRFDNNGIFESNSTLMYDWSNKLNHGTIISNPQKMMRQGKFGGYFDFDGTDDTIVNNYPSEYSVGSFTLLAWVNFGGEMSGRQRIFSVQNGSQYYLALNNSNLECGSSLDGLEGENSTYSQELNDSQWHLIGCMRDRLHANFTWYIDGALVKSVNITNSDAYFVSSGVYVGSNGSAEYFDGGMDELAVFNRYLEMQEIRAAYNATGSVSRTANDLQSYQNMYFKAVDSSGSLSSIARVFVAPGAPGSGSSGSGGAGFINSGETCYDSDGGKNYFKSGKVTISTAVFTDKCLNRDILTEYYCTSSGELNSEQYDCKGWCYSGACNLPASERFQRESALRIAGSLVQEQVLEEVNNFGGASNSAIERWLCGDFVRQSPINASADEEYQGYSAMNSIDGNFDTRWHGNFDSEFPKSIVFDYGKKMCLKSVDLYFHEWDLPITANLYVSNDGTTWDKVISDNSFFLPRTIGVNLPKTIVARYIKVEETSSSRTHGELSEIQFLSGEYNETRGRSLKLR